MTAAGPFAAGAPGEGGGPAVGAAVPGVMAVQLDGVVARDAAGPRGSARGALQGVTAALGPGVHVFLGTPEDGTIALCDVLAGARRALRGSVRIAGEDPWSNPSARARVGALLAAPELPDARTVRGSVALALAALGADGGGGAAAGADAALGALGLGGLASRRTVALSYAETRAVELALALAVAKSAPAPAVAVLFEPCGDIALPAGARAADDAITALRDAGACVVVATSSTADARRLADVLWTLHRGAIIRRETGAAVALGQAELAVWLAPSDGAALRALAAALAQSPAVRGAFWEDPTRPGQPPVLRLRGADRDACALAVIDAAAAAGIAIEALTSSVPDLPSARNAALARFYRPQGGRDRGPHGPAPSGQAVATGSATDSIRTDPVAEEGLATGAATDPVPREAVASASPTDQASGPDDRGRPAGGTGS